MDAQLGQLEGVLPLRVMAALGALTPDRAFGVTELRLRADLPVTVTHRGEVFYLSSVGGLTPICDRPVTLSAGELEAVFHALCRDSLYARAEEIANGFVTYRGCRAGLCGEAVREAGRVVGFRRLSAINLRIAREHKGVAKELLSHVLEDGALRATLLAAPPGCGKTTMLRDLCRLLSLRRYRVAVIDERSEIAGEPGRRFDLAATDVLSGLPKAVGMEMALRTLAPQVMVIDELGDEQEVQGLLNCLNAGVPVVASCHAATLEQLGRRPQVRRLLKAGALERVVLLEGERLGEIQAVYEVGDVDDQAAWRGADRARERRSGLLEFA
ncbi:MAG: AAA family ATPase [Clostridiales bacterium]|nr:AAA family ATPase [Clostridiales bacterium]